MPEQASMREAYGRTLVELGKENPDIVVLDAPSAEEVLANQATATHVFKRGRLVATNEITRNLYME